MVKKYFGNGKLLLTGEYLVLDGAKALSLPVKFGQYSTITENETTSGVIEWKAKEHDMIWFQAELDISTLKVLSSSNEPTANLVTDILLVIQEEFPAFSDFDSLSFEHSVNFPLFWGLGSSSSLLSNMATWAGIDPFYLHQRVSTGSGYDVFTARCHTPIIYQLIKGNPSVEETSFLPPFHKQLYFVYQGQKQDTALEVEEFRKKKHFSGADVSAINLITEQMLTCQHLSEFEKLILEHEKIISNAIGKKTIMDTMVSDYNYGIVKSLGAWGGDFMLFTLNEDRHPQVLIEYLQRKNLDTIFQYKDLILNP